MTEEFPVEEEFYDYYGCSLPRLTEGSVVIGAICLMKVLNPDGSVSFHEFSSNLDGPETLGMLITASDSIRERIMGRSKRLR